MENLDYWRLCDDLSVVQAALLIVGEDPSQNSNVENFDTQNRPVGYEAAKTAILNSITRDDIDYRIAREEEYDFNGSFIGYSDKLDIFHTTVSVSSLKTFLKKRGINSGFFFPDNFEERNYLDRENACYAPKLAAAVMAWEAVSSNESLLNGKTPKQALEKWLREHANEYGLTDAEGNPIVGAIEQIAKVANWRPEGGAARTPTSPQVTENPIPPGKSNEFQYDNFDPDSEIPF